MVLDLVQYEEGTWPGFIILIDLTGVSLGHIAKLDLLSVQQVLYYLQVKILYILKLIVFSSRGAAARSVTVKSTGCGFNPHSRR